MQVQNYYPAAWLAWHWLTPFHPITGALSTITAKGLSRTVSLKGGFTFVPVLVPTFLIGIPHKAGVTKMFYLSFGYYCVAASLYTRARTS